MDVVIIGGGVQGLWLLNDLQKVGYATLLLEKEELGGGQTCHSHVYIHQGYLYREEHLAHRLHDTWMAWQAWLKQNPCEFEGQGSWFGFDNPADAQRQDLFWQSLELFADKVPIPEVLKGGGIREIRQSPEITLNGEKLVRLLQEELTNYISLVAQINEIRVDWSKRTVEALTATSPNGRQLTFRPRTLVLAAGQGNQALLELAALGNAALQSRIYGVQQIRKSHMLVVKGHQDNLKPLMGVFPPYDGLFIVSRVLKDGAVVWLASDNRSWPVTPEEYSSRKYSASYWLPAVLGHLERLAPACFDSNGRARLMWGVYDGPKAEPNYESLRERGELPPGECIEDFGMKNCWTVWPVKLTLAPRASSELVERVRKCLNSNSRMSIPGPWAQFREPAPVAKERWEITPLLEWESFRHHHRISMP